MRLEKNFIKRLCLFVILLVGLLFISGCKKKEYKVYFVDFGEVINVQVVKEGEILKQPDDCECEGYEFVGWEVDDNPYYFNTPVTSNLYIEASYKKINYVVRCIIDDDHIYKHYIDYKQSAEFITAPTKEGYEFVCWLYNGKPYDTTQILTCDIDLVAKYEPKKYTVNFINGELIVDSIEVYYNQTIDKVIEEPTKDGCNFIGWYDSNGKKFDFNTLITSNIYLIAKFENKKYNVKFMADGVEINTIQVEYNSKAIAPNAPLKEGYVFTSWDKDITCITKDIEVNAIYEVKKCNVKFVNGEEIVKEETLEYNSKITYPTALLKEGYTFTGWDKDITNIKEDVVINAVFEVISYSIKYFDGANELSYPELLKYTIEDDIYLPTYNLDGYEFYGWGLNSNFTGNILTKLNNNTGDLTLYALNVKYDLCEGSKCWDTTPYTSTSDAGKGIDSISNLPEIFEQDFYSYLVNNNLLNSSKVNEKLRVTNFLEFSGDNKVHNNDPRKIWNDTSSNAAGAADGYANFFFDKIVVNSDYTVKSVEGGLFGTEPYKSKYFALLNTLVAMYKYKVETASYADINLTEPKIKAFLAFIIDGYFYGTQGVAKSYFSSLRMVIPSMTVAYMVDGTSCKAFNVNENMKVSPIKVGYTFGGWYLDKEYTKQLGIDVTTSLSTIYAKWIEVK